MDSPSKHGFSRWSIVSVSIALVLSVGSLPIAASPSSSSLCGRTITATIDLGANVGPCHGSGLIVGANGVTVDCHHHIIYGNRNTTQAFAGIEVAHYNGTIIKNCTVARFSIGALLFDTFDDTIVSSLFSHNVESGVWLDPCSFCNVTSNKAVSSGDGFEIEGGSNNTMLNNIATHGEDGFALRYTSKNRVASNTASYNLNGGFYILGFKNASENVLWGNRAIGNGFGFGLFRTNNNTLTYNIARGNYYGYYLTNSSFNVLRGNSAIRNRHNGFTLRDSSDGNSVVGNTAYRNRADGFAIVHRVASPSENLFHGDASDHNLGHGYYDQSVGSGTLGTANNYAEDEASANFAGGSSPPRLASPQA